jgi:Recombinase
VPTAYTNTYCVVPSTRVGGSSAGRMIINEREAEIVRYVFETYASEQIGLDRIAKRLEDMGAITKTGKKLWRRSFLKTVLRNETYLGVKYYNTMRVIREYANPIYDIKHSTLKRINRSREEWIGVEQRAPKLYRQFARWPSGAVEKKIIATVCYRCLCPPASTSIQDARSQSCA